jgi:hypothetical protein
VGSPTEQHNQLNVNPADERIPSGLMLKNKRNNWKPLPPEKIPTKKTTDGYVITESGPVDNFAVEPPMYYEKDGR